MASSAFAADGSGTASANTLKLLRHARGAGMGGAHLALADDAGAVAANPAGLVELRNIQLSASHLEWLDGVRDDSAQLVLPIYGFGAWGLSCSYLYAQDQGRDNWGNLTDAFNVFDFSAAASFALQLGSEASAGVNYRILRQGYAGRFSMGSAFDVGLRYKGFFDRKLILALASQNMGTDTALGVNFAPLPWTLKAGAAYRINRDWALEADFEHVTWQYFNRWRLGGEYTYALGEKGRGAFRAGYVIGPENQAGSLSGASLGLGAGLGGWSVDYAFSPMGDLGMSHRATLTLEFGVH